jgi:hypothetical protein
MPQNFDPNIPGIIQGEVTGLSVIDPAADLPGELGNLVINQNRDFEVLVSWEVFQPFAPLWVEGLGALGASWNVRVYAESVGPGDEIEIGSTAVDVSANVACSVHGGIVNCRGYSATVPVPAGTLKEDSPSQSGVYKLVATVFLNSNLGEPGFDMAGYQEGPVIRAEDGN